MCKAGKRGPQAGLAAGGEGTRCEGARGPTTAGLLSVTEATSMRPRTGNTWHSWAQSRCRPLTAPAGAQLEPYARRVNPRIFFTPPPHWGGWI